MKKLLLIAALAAGIYSCGPSAEEKAKMEQARQDSMKAAEDMMQAAEAAAASMQTNDSISSATGDTLK